MTRTCPECGEPVEAGIVRHPACYAAAMTRHPALAARGQARDARTGQSVAEGAGLAGTAAGEAREAL